MIKTKPANGSAGVQPASSTASSSNTRIEIEAVHIRQPDGAILVRPGRARVLPEEIGTAEFSRRCGLSLRQVEHLCDIGVITARKLSPLPRSRWRIPFSELERLREQSAGGMK